MALQGIITSTAREYRYPLPLLSTAEQLYLTAISAGWGTEDDCALVRLYVPSQPDLLGTQAGRSPSATPTISLETIEDLMVGVHATATAEAMSFCTRLGIDVELMYDIVSNAAGASAVFNNRFAAMKQERWMLRGKEMEDVRSRLVSIRPMRDYWGNGADAEVG